MENFEIPPISPDHKIVVYARFCPICQFNYPLDIDISKCPVCKQKLFVLARIVKKEV